MSTLRCLPASILGKNTSISFTNPNQIHRIVIIVEGFFYLIPFLFDKLPSLGMKRVPIIVIDGDSLLFKFELYYKGGCKDNEIDRLRDMLRAFITRDNGDYLTLLSSCDPENPDNDEWYFDDNILNEGECEYIHLKYIGCEVNESEPNNNSTLRIIYREPRDLSMR